MGRKKYKLEFFPWIRMEHFLILDPDGEFPDPGSRIHIIIIHRDPHHYKWECHVCVFWPVGVVPGVDDDILLLLAVHVCPPGDVETPGYGLHHLDEGGGRTCTHNQSIFIQENLQTMLFLLLPVFPFNCGLWLSH